MLLGDQSTEYKNYSNPIYGSQYGDYEYLRYMITAQGLAAAGKDQITLPSHSNAAVKAGFVFTSSVGYSAVTGSFTALMNNAATLATAVSTPKNEAPSVTTTRLALSGELNASAKASTAHRRGHRYHLSRAIEGRTDQFTPITWKRKDN